jgi:hypothetical protein
VDAAALWGWRSCPMVSWGEKMQRTRRMVSVAIATRQSSSIGSYWSECVSLVLVAAEIASVPLGQPSPGQARPPCCCGQRGTSPLRSMGLPCGCRYSCSKRWLGWAASLWDVLVLGGVVVADVALVVTAIVPLGQPSPAPARLLCSCGQRGTRRQLRCFQRFVALPCWSS